MRRRVLKLELKVAPRASPRASLAAPPSVTTYLSAAMLGSLPAAYFQPSTAAIVTLLPPEAQLTFSLSAVKVDTPSALSTEVVSMASLKVILIGVSPSTPVALLAGGTEPTVGEAVTPSRPCAAAASLAWPAAPPSPDPLAPAALPA